MTSSILRNQLFLKDYYPIVWDNNLQVIDPENEIRTVFLK